MRVGSCQPLERARRTISRHSSRNDSVCICRRIRAAKRRPRFLAFCPNWPFRSPTSRDRVASALPALRLDRSPNPRFLVVTLSYLMFISYAYLEHWLMHAPYLLYAVPSTTFLALMLPAALSKSHRLPTRSLTVLVVATLSTFYWFCSSVGNAFDYQSTFYIIGTIAANACCVLALWMTWFMLRKRFNFASLVVWNVALIGWLFGLPSLGWASHIDAAEQAFLKS